MRTAERGITLVELMTVLVIVAILASIAIPSYSQYVRRSNRAEAKTALLENAQFLERNFTVTNSYAIGPGGAAITNASLPVQRTPKDGGAAKYTITVDLAGTSFTLKATPAPGSTMAEDECGELTITNTGVKGSAADAATCWSK